MNFSLEKFRKQNAERALKILNEGPINREELTRRLLTSPIETGHALNVLRRYHPIKIYDEIIMLKEEK